jgi:hypothetical protein
LDDVRDGMLRTAARNQNIPLEEMARRWERMFDSSSDSD